MINQVYLADDIFHALTKTDELFLAKIKLKLE